MDKFRTFMDSYTFISENEWVQIKERFTPKRISKNTLLVESGRVCRHLYFLEAGLMRYYIDKDGNDITKFFTDAPYVFTSQVSFTTQQPAKENIEALEDSILWEMNLSDANELLKLESWNNFIRKLIQEVQFFTEGILTEIQTETAENRYRKMITFNPDLVNRIQLKHLASYFGIAPQSLSRIRNKIMND